tara:strand:- start:4027 stop:4359 length:333 start_codon:yes stop_codon:yes gene_type:complete
MAQENTISLNYGDNQEMRAFIDALGPAVGGSISINVSVGVQEYDENRLVGVITNVDRDPYADYQQSPAAEEFTGMTEASVPDFDASDLADDMMLSPDAYGESEEEIEEEM